MELINIIRKDFWPIVILLVAILLTMYALNNVKAVEQRCNEHWVQEFKNKCGMFNAQGEFKPIIKPIDAGIWFNSTS